MSEHKLYRIDGKLYRREATPKFSCHGCSFREHVRGLDCRQFPCVYGSQNFVAKRIPDSLPVPAGVIIEDLT